jgi:signal transduction histidine kinase
MIDDIHTSSIRLISIVNDFLDVSRLEQGKLKLNIQPFDICDVVKDVIFEMTELAREKHNQLDMKSPSKPIPKVFADKDRVKQILYNLVGNAMKFTNNGNISLSVSLTDKIVKILVTDTGPGISEQNQQVLFHKFQQASDNILTRSSSQSTGLGLYISRLLANKMGGEVKLESSILGKGSTFSYSVPIYSNQIIPDTTNNN